MRSISILLALILLPVFAYGTTPTISNVTGTVSNGQTLTITGTSMMDENKTNWISLFSSGTAYGFEGTSITADGYDMGGGNAYDPVYVTDVKLAGSKSVKGHGQGAFNAGGGGPACVAYFLTGAGDVGDRWARFYVRFHLNGGTWPTNYQKVVDTQGSTGNQYYIDLGPGSSSPPTTINATYDSTAHQIPWNLVQDQWHLVEWHVKSSTPRAYTLYIDNVLITDAVPTLAATIQYFLFPMINYDGTNSSFNEDVWMDNLAVSTSRIYPSSTVEISGDNGSTWTYQPPTTLGDSSIAVTATLPTLTASNYLLRVTNNRQESSSNYTLGGGSSTGGSLRPGVSASGVTFR